jgi:DNA-directed RNA polymerase specialized sigma24 family protein
MSRTPPTAFVSLLQAQQEGLVRAARLLTGDWERAEDLLQLTMAWALANWGTFEEDGTPAALVVRLRLVALFLAGSEPDAPADASADADPDGDAPAVEDPTIAIRPGTSLLDSLTVLPPKDRAIVVGRYYLSLSAAEIGTMIGIAAEDVDATAVSILAGLRRRTADIGGTG